MSYVSKNPRFDTTTLTDQGTGGSPGNPASGSHRIVDRNGILYLRDSSGNETALGSGSGELNVVTNPSTFGGTWAASGAGVTVATSTTGSDLPLSAIIPTSIKITPVSGTDYARYRWTMPSSLKQTKLKVQWNQLPLSGYASGDLKLEVYTNSASNYGGSYTKFNLSTDSSGVSAIPLVTGRYTSTFDTDSSDYYELRIVRVSGTTALNLANVIVGPGIQPQGAVVTDWISYTPSTAGMGTISNTNVQYRRVGSAMEIVGTWANGSSSGVASTISLPTGTTIDTTRIGGSLANAIGEYHQAPAATNYFSAGDSGVLTYDSATGTSLLRLSRKGNTNTALLQETGTALIDSTASFFFRATVPIAEWAGAGAVTLGSSEPEFASNFGQADSDDTTSFAYGPQGSLIQQGPTLSNQRRRRVRFQRPIQANETVFFQVDLTGTGKWVTPTATGRFDALSASFSLQLFKKEGGISAGMGGIEDVNGSLTDFDVTMGVYRLNDVASFGGAGINWAPANIYWRLVKCTAGAAVGFGIATETQAGLVKLPSSQQSLRTANGYGSSNTEVIRWTTQDVNVGSNITYADSATLGGSFTINKAGVYSVSMSVRSSGGSGGATLTQNATTVGNASTTLAITSIQANLGASLAWTGRLAAGDVIRGCGNFGTPDTASARMIVTEVVPFY